MSHLAANASHGSPWRIDGNKARLESDNLRAEVDLRNPAGGVSILAVEGAIVTDATLFRVRLPRSTSDSNVDSFARGNDLIATYSETAVSPFRAQIYWRFIPSTPGDGATGTNAIAALELIVSIQTNLLDSDPTLSVATDISAVRASRLIDAQSTRMIDLSAAPLPIAIGPDTGTGCLVFQLADAPLAYIEMLHPADFHRSTLHENRRGLSPFAKSTEQKGTVPLSADGSRIGAADSHPLCLSHQLFAQHLEKGVILRSRLLGVFAPTETNPAIIARVYQEFAGSEPPLTA